MATMNNFANKIADTMVWYLHKYHTIDWRFIDEGLLHVIMDYYTSYGTFTESEKALLYAICKEYGYSLEDILTLCEN